MFRNSLSRAGLPHLVFGVDRVPAHNAFHSSSVPLLVQLKLGHAQGAGLQRRPCPVGRLGQGLQLLSEEGQARFLGHLQKADKGWSAPPRPQQTLKTIVIMCHMMACPALDEGRAAPCRQLMRLACQAQSLQLCLQEGSLWRRAET